MSDDDRPPRRRVQFDRRPRPRPPLWPVLAAAIVLVMLIVISRWLES